jgi:hypothetical protein
LSDDDGDIESRRFLCMRSSVTNSGRRGGRHSDMTRRRIRNTWKMWKVHLSGRNSRVIIANAWRNNQTFISRPSLALSSRTMRVLSPSGACRKDVDTACTVWEKWTFWWSRPINSQAQLRQSVQDPSTFELFVMNFTISNRRDRTSSLPRQSPSFMVRKSQE